MKKVFLPLIITLVSVAGLSAQEGVLFRSITLNEAVRQAAEENKYVFVDCYTSWCVPCKMMEQSVFSKEEAGGYFNPRFISVKYDLEKEEDGKMLAKEYDITSVPTFLIFGPDGTFAHKITGAGETEEFIQKVERCFDDTKAYAPLKKAYESGNYSKEDLLNFVESFSIAGDPALDPMLDSLFACSSEAEVTGPDYWFIFSSAKISPHGSPREMFLFENYREFRDNIGSAEVDKHLVERYRSIFSGVANFWTDMTAEQLAARISLMREAGLGSQGGLEQYARLASAAAGGDMDMYMDAAREVVPQLEWPAYQIMSYGVVSNSSREQAELWLEIGKAVGELLLPEQQKELEGYLQHLKARIEKEK